MSKEHLSRRRVLGTAALLGAGATTGLNVFTAPPALAAPPVPTFTAPPDPYAAYDGQNTCDPDPKPGVLDFRGLVLDTYRSTGDFGISRACGDGGQSEHKEGRAWDWRVSAASQHNIADNLIHWLLATRDGRDHALARRLGIMYIIWDRRIWRAWEQSWAPYDGSNPHTDHVHFSFSWAGARKRTTWWTARQDVVGGNSLAVASWGAGRLDVFARGSGGQLVHKVRTENAPGPTGFTAAVTSRQAREWCRGATVASTSSPATPTMRSPTRSATGAIRTRGPTGLIVEAT